MSKIKLDLSLNNIISCVFFAIIGLLLIILQGSSLGILMTIIGALFIIVGLISIIRNKKLTQGIIEIIIGIALIVCGWLIASIMLLIFGIILVLIGITQITSNLKNGIMPILSAVLTIVIGVLLIIAKWTLLDVFCLVAGIIFLINAVLTLFGNPIIQASKRA